MASDDAMKGLFYVLVVLGVVFGLCSICVPFYGGSNAGAYAAGGGRLTGMGGSSTLTSSDWTRSTGGSGSAFSSSLGSSLGTGTTGTSSAWAY